MYTSDVSEQLLKCLEALQKSNLESVYVEKATWGMLTQLRDFILHMQNSQMRLTHPNPLTRRGQKCFSQTDEDGITLEIIRRLGVQQGVYAEFGVGDGLENNTLILAALGWRGFWVGGEDLAFDFSRATKFTYIKDWVTLENIMHHANTGLNAVNNEKIDVISLDFDGNDIYFVEKLLSGGIIPKLFIVEYNGKFIPPARFQIEYNPQHRWTGDDYFGAALMNFVEMFAKYDFSLVACNAHTGANAFFVHNDYKSKFKDIPENIIDIYTPPNYHLFHRYGHPQSAKVVAAIINQ